MILDIGELHEWLDRLNWGEGLRAPGDRFTGARARRGTTAWVPLAVEQLPSDRLFRGAGEVASYVRHLMRSGVLPGDLKPFAGAAAGRLHRLADRARVSVARDAARRGVGRGLGLHRLRRADRR